MDPSRSTTFHDAALRSDPSSLRYQTPETLERQGALGKVEREPVVSDRGVPAYSEERTSYRGERRRFSLGATFLGWSVAAFFTLVFTIALAGLAGVELADGMIDLSGPAFASIAAYLAATFAAYLIGGYAAGRIALWDGVKHGMLIVMWAVVFAIGAIALGATLAAQFDVTTTIPVGMDAITMNGIVAVVLTLIAMLAGSGLGGKLGERYHDRVHGGEDRRRAARLRGRPL